MLSRGAGEIPPAWFARSFGKNGTLRFQDAGRLVEVLPDWSTPEIWLTLYYPPYEQLPLRVATFSDFFEAFIKESWDA